MELPSFFVTIHGVAGCHRDDCGSDQDDNEQIGKLVKKDRSDALFLLLDQSIFPIGL